MIPDSVITIGDRAFRDCYSLTSVTIPNGVTTIGDEAFRVCSGLTSVTIGNSVASIGKGAFDSCNGLKSVCINSLESWLSISFQDEKAQPLLYAHHLFLDNQELTSITIPEGVRSIESYAFSWCYGLTSITIPDSVTSIGTKAFYGCSGLTSLVIPGSVTSVGSAVFCRSGLTSVTFMGDAPGIASDAFGPIDAIIAEVFYDSGFDGWTEDKIQNYGGMLTWHDMNQPPIELDKPEIRIDPEYDYGQVIRIDISYDENVQYYEISDNAYVDYDEESGKATLVFQTYGWGMKQGENTITVKAIGKKGYLDSEEMVLTFTINPMNLEVIERYDWTYYRSGERVGIAFYPLIDDYYADSALYTVTVADPNGDPILIWDEDEDLEGYEVEPSFFDRKSSDGQKYWMVLFNQYNWFEHGYGPGTYTITVTAFDEGMDETCTVSREFALKNDAWGGYEYSINEDGSVTITNAMLDENNVVKIPKEINGMKVSTISATVLDNIDTTDITIEIPKTVVKVEEGAIQSGTTVTTPKNSPSWFYGKAYDWVLMDNNEEIVPTIELPASLTSLSKNAFIGINAECVILPEGCSVDSGALADCPNLLTVVFHEGAGTLTEVFGENESGKGILIVNAEFGEAEHLMNVDF